MDELDHGSQLNGRLVDLTTEFGAEQQQAGANPFPATFLQVFPDLVDGVNRGMPLARKFPFDLPQLVFD
jgi:hypothetical protein